MTILCSRRAQVLAATGSLALAMTTGAAQADQITGYLYDNTSYAQTSDSAPTTPIGYFFSLGATFTTPGDYTTATASYPGSGSPQNLPTNGSTGFNFNSSFYSSLSDLHADYPFGTYTISASGGPAGTATANISYNADPFTGTVPYLTNYSALNGMDPDAAMTVLYNAFTPDPSSTEGFTFLTIYDAGSPVFSDEFQSPSSTSAVIAADTLLADTTYTYEIDCSDRIDGFDDADDEFTEQGFDVRTDGTFTTGAAPVSVPEPGTLSLLGSGLVLSLIRRRRRARSI
jgi:hypothetical protein